jgi:hypothetical protein
MNNKRKMKKKKKKESRPQEGLSCNATSSLPATPKPDLISSRLAVSMTPCCLSPEVDLLLPGPPPAAQYHHSASLPGPLFLASNLPVAYLLLRRLPPLGIGLALEGWREFADEFVTSLLPSYTLHILRRNHNAGGS